MPAIQVDVETAKAFWKTFVTNLKAFSKANPKSSPEEKLKIPKKLTDDMQALQSAIQLENSMQELEGINWAPENNSNDSTPAKITIDSETLITLISYLEELKSTNGVKKQDLLQTIIDAARKINPPHAAEHATATAAAAGLRYANDSMTQSTVSPDSSKKQFGQCIADYNIDIQELRRMPTIARIMLNVQIDVKTSSQDAKRSITDALSIIATDVKFGRGIDVKSLVQIRDAVHSNQIKTAINALEDPRKKQFTLDLHDKMIKKINMAIELANKPEIKDLPVKSARNQSSAL